MTQPQMDVLMLDPGAKRAVRRSAKVRVVKRVQDVNPKAALFIFTPATRLREVSEVARSAGRDKLLKALVVVQDVSTTMVLELLGHSKLTEMANLIVRSGSEQLTTRIVNAWRLGAQHQLIADAELVGDTLHVINCAFERFDVPLETFSALREIPATERPNFEVAEDGAFLHWPSPDVHLDLDSIRIETDPEYREAALLEAATRGRAFGQAVQALREKHGLRQVDIKGISERQIRRIEQGSVPRRSTLLKFADAHGLDLEAYLNQLAATARQIRARSSPQQR